jgi:hypothetical protein
MLHQKARSTRKAMRSCGKHAVMHHDQCGADRCADHPEPALAQRSPELQLAHNRGGGTRPKRIVEFEPERNEESEAHRRPEAKCVQQWRSSLRRIREGRVSSANGTFISSRSGLVECVCHYPVLVHFASAYRGFTSPSPPPICAISDAATSLVPLSGRERTRASPKVVVSNAASRVGGSNSGFDD